jgi:glycosyltransferase involved in cell wall biosynthesis
MKLSILICTIPERKEMLDDLILSLWPQIEPYSYEIEIIINDSNLNIGAKRNALIEKSTGEYVCFIDDDDSVSENYINFLMLGINKEADCCSLKGEYSVDGKLDGIFEHSIKYNKWETVTMYEKYDKYRVKYLRYPNHLNCIKTSIAKQFKFPEKNFGEDHDWSKQIHESGLIKTEHYIPEVIYYYKKVTK